MTIRASQIELSHRLTTTARSIRVPTQIKTTWDDRAVEAAVDEAISTRRTKVPPSRMRLAPFNGFSGELRNIADRKIKVAIELGLIPKAALCSVCGAIEGRIDYHNEDYSR